MPGPQHRNEPDLNSPCINPNNVINTTQWRVRSPPNSYLQSQRGDRYCWLQSQRVTPHLPRDASTHRRRDYYLIQSGAIRHAFADLNADLAAGRILACPQSFLPCPLQPYILASAFSSATFSDTSNGPDAYLGAVTVSNEHTVFPGYPQDPTVQNMQVGRLLAFVVSESPAAVASWYVFCYMLCVCASLLYAVRVREHAAASVAPHLP